MNRITKEYYNRIFPLMLTRSIPNFVRVPYGSKINAYTRAISDIKFECRKLCTRWTVASDTGSRMVYFKTPENHYYEQARLSVYSWGPIYTGRVILVDGEYQVERIEKEVTWFRANKLNHLFKRQAERKLELLNSRLKKFMEKEANGYIEDDKVYFMKDTVTQEIKIGVSREPEKRRAAIECKIQHPIYIMAVIDGGYKREKELHRQFASLRTHGEWFSPGSELCALVNSVSKPYVHKLHMVC